MYLTCSGPCGAAAGFPTHQAWGCMKRTRDALVGCLERDQVFEMGIEFLDEAEMSGGMPWQLENSTLAIMGTLPSYDDGSFQYEL